MYVSMSREMAELHWQATALFNDYAQRTLDPLRELKALVSTWDLTT